MLGARQRQPSSSRVPLWLCLIACAISFFVGININVISSHDVAKVSNDLTPPLPPLVAALPSCMANSFHQLCSSLKIFSQAALCHQEPEKFVMQNYQMYKPSSTQLQTQELMYTKQIRSLSVGAGPGKETICSDVIPGATICTNRDVLDLFEINGWSTLVAATRSRDTNKSSEKVEGFDVLFAEHVLEHFDPVQATLVAAASFAALKPGGVFRIAVPDGYKPSQNYQKYVRPGSTPQNGAQSHMVSWTIDTLPSIFESVGYQIEPKEYFTSAGKFVSVEGAYDAENKLGKVGRSFRNDKRNVKPYKHFNMLGGLSPSDLREDEPFYTSLWFDAVKPESCDYVIGNKKNLKY